MTRRLIGAGALAMLTMVLPGAQRDARAARGWKVINTPPLSFSGTGGAVPTRSSIVVTGTLSFVGTDIGARSPSRVVPTGELSFVGLGADWRSAPPLIATPLLHFIGTAAAVGTPSPEGPASPPARP